MVQIALELHWIGPGCSETALDWPRLLWNCTGAVHGAPELHWMRLGCSETALARCTAPAERSNAPERVAIPEHGHQSGLDATQDENYWPKDNKKCIRHKAAIDINGK